LNQLVHIACAADSSYIQHTCVMLKSLLTNNSNLNLVIHVFSSDFTDKNKESILEISNAYNKTVNFYLISNKNFDGFVISHHISLATYYRIIIPQLLSPEIEKLIYLDCDIIINGNIEPLWNLKLENYIIAATPEPVFNDFDRLNINPKNDYFNAGILVLNLVKWRENKTTEKVITYIQENLEKIVFWDQDALNACLQQNWLRFEPKYNQQSAIFEIADEKLLKAYTLEELNEAKKNPIIIHYTGSSKPWQLFNYHPYKKQYWYYLKQTPFKNFVIPNNTIVNKIKHLFIYFLTPYFKKKIGLA
jgi:lipopolysaccharide biosynthesis glycosyltransferase